MNTQQPICWSISDGRAGNERQALALARALGLQPRNIRVQLAQPWSTLAPHLTMGAAAAIADGDGARLSPPWPDIAIGCGRRAALLTRLLAKWSDGHTFRVQILNPRIDSGEFDVVIAPAHDDVSGSHTLTSIGALNPVDQAWLAAARVRFHALGDLPSPRTAVLVGASNRAQTLDAAYFDGLVERLAAKHAQAGGSFLVSVSRRTPAAVTARLRAAFARFEGHFFDGVSRDGVDSADQSRRENPYAGFLAWADRIVVTPDSVNMISEACATGKPVYTFAPRPIRGKLRAFHQELTGSGHLRRLDDVLPHLRRLRSPKRRRLPNSCVHAGCSSRIDVADFHVDVFDRRRQRRIKGKPARARYAHDR